MCCNPFHARITTIKSIANRYNGRHVATVRIMGKEMFLFKKIWLALFFVTSILRFALLPTFPFNYQNLEYLLHAICYTSVLILILNLHFQMWPISNVIKKAVLATRHQEQENMECLQ